MYLSFWTSWAKKASPPDAGRQHEEGLLLAANCFDNTLRVFHRRFLNPQPPQRPRRRSNHGGGGGNNSGSSNSSGGGAAATTTAGMPGAAAASALPAAMSTTSSQSNDAGKGGALAATGEGEDKEPSLELMHALRGHTVKNWPIR